jgi:CRP-like cAMP-binding protein
MERTPTSLMTQEPVRRQRLAVLGLFRGLRRTALDRIAAACIEVEVEPGRELCRAGEPAREFVIVLDGAASVTVNGQETHRLGAGSCFGEIGLVDGYEHPMTVTAVSPMRLLLFPGDDFLELLHSDPDFTARVLAIVAGRLRMLMSEISEWADPDTRSPSRRPRSAHSGEPDDGASGGQEVSKEAP